MKKPVRSFFVALALTASSVLSAQTPAAPKLEFPSPSPSATSKQRVGITDIEINYSRPSTKGRKIFGAGDAFLAGYLAAAANGSPPPDRLTLALRWGATAVQHQGTLFSQVDERIPVFVAAADPTVTLSEPAAP